MNLNITIDSLKSALKNVGHTMFESDEKDYNLNIIGIRSNNPITNKFNDLMNPL